MKGRRSLLGNISTWVAIFLMIGFWVWFFKFAPIDRLSEKAKTAYQAVFVDHPPPQHTSQFDDAEKQVITSSQSETVCDSEPPIHGSKFKLSKNAVGSKLHSRLFVTNEHQYPVLLTLIEAENDAAYGALFLHPNQSSQVKLPDGNYMMEIKAGEKWCNIHQGFSQGVIITPQEQLSIKVNQVTNLRLMSFGSTPEDIMVSLSSSLGITPTEAHGEIEGTGSLILQRVVGGHYAVEGTINRIPVYFMVDTGATSVSVSENFAKHAGITQCNKAKSRTANGVTDICVAIASELTIGQFKLKNVEVSYSKGISDDIFLLGMNVIGQFKMEQQGDVMKLTLP